MFHKLNCYFVKIKNPSIMLINMSEPEHTALVLFSSCLSHQLI